MESFKVTYRLATPVVAPKNIRLDALIMQRKLIFDGQAKLDGVPVTDTWKIIDLPLKKYPFIGDKFYYSASHGVFDDSFTIKDRFFKRIDCEVLAGTSVSNINTGSGKYCSSITEYENIHTDKIVFFGEGNITACEKLLSGVTSIGGLRKQGRGIVSAFEIKSIHCARAGLVQGGILVRDIPISKKGVVKYLQKASKGTSVDMRQTRIVPPYHKRYSDVGSEVCIGFGSDANILF